MRVRVVCEIMGQQNEDLDQQLEYGHTVHALELWAASKWGLKANTVISYGRCQGHEEAERRLSKDMHLGHLRGAGDETSVVRIRSLGTAPRDPMELVVGYARSPQSKRFPINPEAPAAASAAVVASTAAATAAAAAVKAAAAAVKAAATASSTPPAGQAATSASAAVLC